MFLLQALSYSQHYSTRDKSNRDSWISSIPASLKNSCVINKANSCGHEVLLIGFYDKLYTLCAVSLCALMHHLRRSPSLPVILTRKTVCREWMDGFITAPCSCCKNLSSKNVLIISDQHSEALVSIASRIKNKTHEGKLWHFCLIILLQAAYFMC